MIQIEDLHYTYPSSDFELNIPELHLRQGETLAVIGPSGSGKTTLLNLISGILPVQSGTVQVDNKSIHQLNDRQRRQFRLRQIGFIFQDFELLDYLNVLDNILHCYRISSSLTLDRNTRERAMELAREMGLMDKLKRYPKALSQGERQRVAICRALLPGPSLLLADEATGNLDPGNKQRALDTLYHYVDAHDASLLAVTHDHELLPQFDHVVDFNTFRIRGSE